MTHKKGELFLLPALLTEGTPKIERYETSSLAG